MASLQIEGEIEGISENQLQFIRDVLEKRGFKNNKVNIAAASKIGDNFAVTVLRIRVVVEDGDDFMMIAKIAPGEEGLRKNISTDVMFNNEILMYEQVLPKFANLQKAADVPEEDRLKYAKCYGCLSEAPDEIILLEDLKVLNMTMLDKYSSLCDETIRLILKNFAILHSLSFVLKKLEPTMYDSFRTSLINMFDKEFPEFDAVLETIESASINAVNDEKYNQFLRGALTGENSAFKKLGKTDAFSKHLVIQQGDGWTNNIMFKLEGSKPIDCIMIDYQLSKEASPVVDIIYMIYSCTNHIDRAKHYVDWIDYYHDELDKSLSNFGIKADFVYPRDKLDADLRRYSKLMFGYLVMVYNILSRNSEEAAEMKSIIETNDTSFDVNKMDNFSEATIAILRTRVMDLIDSYLLFGYL